MIKKDTSKIVIIGHVDHGKSTLIGRLLLETGSLPKDKLAEVKKISRELGKDTEIAYLADHLKEERERNITIDTTQIFFHTRKKNYVIIDVPGHVEFIKNMLTGASHAEDAVLIIDANEGIMEQTRRHAFLISFLGIRSLVIVVNKMDLLGYEESKFNEIKDQISSFMAQACIPIDKIIPISAKEGVNVFKRSRKTPWYRGMTLIEVLDSIRHTSQIRKEPLTLPIQDVYTSGNETIVAGKITSGRIKAGQDIAILPSGNKATIDKIKVFRETANYAGIGENIGIILSDPAGVKRGQVITEATDKIKPKKQFEANIFWMSGHPLKVGDKLLLRCETQEVDCQVQKIVKTVDSSTLEIIGNNVERLDLNQAGIAEFLPARPIVIEDPGFIRELGRFVLEKDNVPIAAGMYLEANQ